MAMHIQAIKNLFSEDYQLIEKEHLLLNEVINYLQGICCNLNNQFGCQGCTREKHASCQGQLTSIIYNLTHLADLHLTQEMSIIRRRLHASADTGHFHSHHQAHANLTRELHEIFTGSVSLSKRGETAEGFRQLYKKMSELFALHDKMFDAPFVRQTES